MTHCCIEALKKTETLIKRSRFIAVISPCQNLDEIHDFLSSLHSQHPQATHIAYAWRLLTDQGLRERFFDAGEPSGTAGRPILNHLQGKNLINCCLAVIRYFGGIKLGAGGLTRAYGQAAREVLELAKIQPHIVYQTVTVEVGYPDYQTLTGNLPALGASVIDADFGAEVKINIRFPEQSKEAINQLLTRFKP